MQQRNVCVFDLGGSAMAPNGPNRNFLLNFRRLLQEWLGDNPSSRIVIVVGGGSAARLWQNMARELATGVSNESLDWIGIQATRLNAELLRSVLGQLCPDPVIINPEEDFSFSGSVIVSAGWKPGFSTDYVSVQLARKMNCRSIFMVSNIAYVYSEDPKINPAAQSLRQVSWEKYSRMVHSEWRPGSSLPFDPVASRNAHQAKLLIKLVSCTDMANIRRLMDGLDFEGSTIGV